jgi:hypothetical protein
VCCRFKPESRWHCKHELWAQSMLLLPGVAAVMVAIPHLLLVEMCTMGQQ